MADAIHFPFPEPPAPGEACTVAPGILWLRIPLPMALDHVNVYALEDRAPDGTAGWVLVDTGFWDEAIEALWLRLLAGPLEGRPVLRVIGTHHHSDHIGMAGWFQRRGAELLMTRTAWLYARMMALEDIPTASAEHVRYWQRAGLAPERIAARSAERQDTFGRRVAPMPLGFTRLAEGQRLTIGAREWEVRIGHGHAPSHVTLWSEGVVLAGDQLLPGISPNIGVYPAEPDADPLGEWLESCERLGRHAGDQLVLPGHKLPYTGLRFRLEQMAENHHQGLVRLLAFLEEPRSAVDCFPMLFKRRIGPAEEGLALAEAIAHLNHLLRQGEITRRLSPEGVWLWQRLGREADASCAGVCAAVEAGADKVSHAGNLPA